MSKYLSPDRGCRYSEYTQPSALPKCLGVAMVSEIFLHLKQGFPSYMKVVQSLNAHVELNISIITEELLTVGWCPCPTATVNSCFAAFASPSSAVLVKMNFILQLTRATYSMTVSLL